MLKQRFDKLFTREEANELIPRLELIVHRLQTLAHEIRSRVGQLAEADPEAGYKQMDLETLIHERPELKVLAENMARQAIEVESYGCFLKDVDLGLVDFPSELGGEIVFLCWQFGEPELATWHSLDSGFAARRPLSGAPKVYLN